MNDDSSYKLVLIILLGLAGVAAFILGRRQARNGFLLFIAALGLGFRTLPVTDSLRIHPAEIALLLVLACVFAKRPEKSVGRNDGSLPWWLWGLLPFMALAWLPRPDNPFPLDEQLAECINVALAVPVFLAARAVLANRDTWRPVVVTLYAVGTCVALLGVTEYVFPGVKYLLPGFVSNPEGGESFGGFIRATFSFYGGPIGVFLCMLSLPFGLAVWRWWRGVAVRAAVAAAALVQLGGVYVSGYRSQWLMLGVMLLVLLLKSRRFWLACLLAGLVVSAYQFLPQGVQGRLGSLEKILEGNPEDSSGVSARRVSRRRSTPSSATHSAAAGPPRAGSTATFFRCPPTWAWRPAFSFFAAIFIRFSAWECGCDPHAFRASNRPSASRSSSHSWWWGRCSPSRASSSTPSLFCPYGWSGR